jgi:hypothetical protein
MIQRFLIFCSGSSYTVLKSCPKSERNKFAAVGATVLMTGILAGISCGYALFTVFRGEIYALGAAIFFGFLWALLIFNLDRYIVSSLRKTGNAKKELLYATPRFIIAILISLIIAKPIEVRIFADRIEQQILENKLNKLVDEKRTIDELNNVPKLTNDVINDSLNIAGLKGLIGTDPTTPEFNQLLVNLDSAENEVKRTIEQNTNRIDAYTVKVREINSNFDNFLLDSITGARSKLRPEIQQEVNGLINSRNILNKEITDARKWREELKKQIEDERKEHKTSLITQLDSAKVKHAGLVNQKASAEKTAKGDYEDSKKIKTRSYSNNFITQVEAMGQLSNEWFSTMWWASILLMLLFVCIETAPILVKLLSKRGPYEEALDRIEYEHYVDQQRMISDKNDEINILMQEFRELNKLKVEMRVKAEKSKLEAEIKANEDLLIDIATKQGELAKVSIDKWYREELAKLNELPPQAPYAKTS